MRLDRLIANAGCGTRSAVKQFIRKGRVRVGEKIIDNPGYILDGSELETVFFDDQPVCWRKFHHLMLNKPADVITALQDSRHRTVADLLPPDVLDRGVVPVGRLDRDATGILLLTSDGMLCHRLTSPRWKVWKTYEVSISGAAFAGEDIAFYNNGVILADGTVCRPAGLDIKDDYRALLSIREGRYHQVKRMMLAAGHKVEALRRISFGPLDLDRKIAPGDFRELSGDEVRLLYETVNLQFPGL